MKKVIIILLSVFVIFGAISFGAFFLITHPSHQYQAADYSFEVPGSFEPLQSEDDTTYTFRFLGEKVTIEDRYLNCTPEAAKGFLTYYEGETNVEVKPFEAAGFKGYFRTSEITVIGRKQICLAYIFGTDTRFFSMDCSCGPLKAMIIKKAMENIAESVVYTSDFRLADKPEVYNYKWVSVNAGKKFACKDKTDEYSEDHSQTEFRMTVVYAEADSDIKTYSPSVTITVKELENSPAEFADAMYDGKLEDQDKYDELTRDQVKLFGYDCEHVKSKKKTSSDDDTVLLCNDQYYLKKDNYVYSISAVYRNSSEEETVKEMFDCITIN